MNMTTIYYGGSKKNSVTCTTARAMHCIRILVEQGYKCINMIDGAGVNWRIRSENKHITSVLPYGNMEVAS